MPTTVFILERISGRVAASIPVAVGGLNITIGSGEFERTAWRAAVDDKSVAPNRPQDYEFKIGRS